MTVEIIQNVLIITTALFLAATLFLWVNCRIQTRKEAECLHDQLKRIREGKPQHVFYGYNAMPTPTKKNEPKLITHQEKEIIL